MTDNDKQFNKPPQKHMPAIFIGGAGRSGTSLLIELLGKHKDIASIYETQLITFLPVRQFPSIIYNKSLNDKKIIISDFKLLMSNLIYRYKAPWKTRDDGWRGLFKLFELDEIKSSLELLKLYEKDINEEESYILFGRFINDLFCRYAKRMSKTLWAEKTPANSRFCDFYYKCFPDLKIINIIRDGRDMVCSLIKEPWGSNEPIAGLDDWYAFLAQSFFSQNDLPLSNCMHVRYENLVTYPEKILKDIIKYIGLDWDPNMLSVKISTQSIGRWKKDLPEEAKEYARSKYGKFLGELGYDV